MKQKVRFTKKQKYSSLRLPYLGSLLSTGCTVHGSNLGGSEIFPTRPDRPRRLHCLPYNGHRVSFPGV